MKSRAVKGYRIHALIKTDAPAGVFKQEVIVKTNDPATPTLTFNVLGNVQATLSVQPELVAFDRVKVGETETKRVLVQGSRPFRILAIDDQGDGVTATATERESNTHFVLIRFNPAKPGETKK